jgi:hypothetical protein
MTASNKTWLAVCLVLAGALSACSSLVTVDRSKVEDEQYEVPEPPPPDAGPGADDEDAGG